MSIFHIYTVSLRHFVEAEYTVTSAQLDRILIGCNQLLRGSGAWRSHAALLENISVLKACVSYTQLAETFMPVLQKEVLQARAIPCRVAAVNTLLQFMREQPEKKKRDEVIEFFNIEIAGHQCCYRRMLYLDIVECVLKLFSRKFFIEHFLEKMLTLIHDKVSNIRYVILPLVKKYLILPDDEEILLSLEKAVRETLTTEKQPTTRQLVQAACELSRTEARAKGDKEDAAREKEEERLWNEGRVAKEETPKKSEMPLPSSNYLYRLITYRSPDNRSSPWRTQRRAVAVVRPQPVYISTCILVSEVLRHCSRSGSPLPKVADGGRPSRLPLSTASKEKEALKKGEAALLSFRQCWTGTVGTDQYGNHSAGRRFHWSPLLVCPNIRFFYARRAISFVSASRVSERNSPHCSLTGARLQCGLLRKI
ncbi:unnamed protein product [Heligmosomoides polygyrus]|uniref:Protein phosphatase 2A regulatory B subunit n=1 Tax=Heligmosomoides polygyrus TaxID=6339 RepID=A0A183GP30_HELPZ|nr:unnamed protein product [Heligmosomoides polygyrus]